MTSLTRRLSESDVAASFMASPVTMLSALVCVLFFSAAALAPLIALTNPYDLKTLDILNSRMPPVWLAGGQWPFLLGTDDQGADILSSILYGARISLVVGFSATLFSVVIGVFLGLAAGYGGGVADALIMRLADVQLTFPAILMALLIGGVAQSALPAASRGDLAVPVLVVAIGISTWVQYARTVRGLTLVEKGKDYVLAARLIGRRPGFVMLGHILPNVLGPVLVIATINLAFAVITEATLSFLGVGVPITQPSLGMLIRFGNDYLLSGEWWIVVFPSLALVILAVAVNLMGDWLRDALNPKLR